MFFAVSCAVSSASSFGPCRPSEAGLGSFLLDPVMVSHWRIMSPYGRIPSSHGRRLNLTPTLDTPYHKSSRGTATPLESPRASEKQRRRSTKKKKVDHHDFLPISCRRRNSRFPQLVRFFHQGRGIRPLLHRVPGTLSRPSWHHGSERGSLLHRERA